MVAQKRLNLSEAEWRKCLTTEQYRVMREKGTEYPCSGAYYQTKDSGTYYCVACEQPLFQSLTKFDSGTGWPSFFEPIDSDCLIYRQDEKLGMIRIEVLCSCCESHLGHVFEDGPLPSGRRYCINSVALKFVKKEA